MFTISSPPDTLLCFFFFFDFFPPSSTASESCFITFPFVDTQKRYYSIDHSGKGKDTQDM